MKIWGVPAFLTKGESVFYALNGKPMIATFHPVTDYFAYFAFWIDTFFRFSDKPKTVSFCCFNSLIFSMIYDAHWCAIKWDISMLSGIFPYSMFDIWCPLYIPLSSVELQHQPLVPLIWNSNGISQQDSMDLQIIHSFTGKRCLNTGAGWWMAMMVSWPKWDG